MLFLFRRTPGFIDRLVPGLVLWGVLVCFGCSSIPEIVKNRTCGLDPVRPYDVVIVDLDQYDLRLFWKDENDRSFLTIEHVRAHVRAQGDSLVAATNAGIYEPGYVPTGLYIEDGVVEHPLNLKDGLGNFYLKPNGVFYLTADAAHIVSASRFDNVPDEVTYATQSGPLLVENGTLHSAFTPSSENCRLRSGVGVGADGTVYLVISNGAVNFFDFAAYFRDVLRCPDALYLDGSISALYAPALNRTEETGQKFAGILAVLLKKK